MKKYLLSLCFVFVLFTMPLSANATAHSSQGNQALIESLMNQIKALQAQLTQMQGGIIQEPFCHTFDTNLGIGASGVDVSALRQVLGLERESLTGEVFDEVLASAVSEFQLEYRSEILTPAGLTAPTGYVGPRTRAKLNALYGCGTVIAPSPTPQPSTAIVYGTNPGNNTRYVKAGDRYASIFSFRVYSANNADLNITGFDFEIKTFPGGTSIDGLVSGFSVVDELGNQTSVSSVLYNLRAQVTFGGRSVLIPAGQSREFKLYADISSSLAVGQFAVTLKRVVNISNTPVTNDNFINGVVDVSSSTAGTLALSTSKTTYTVGERPTYTVYGLSGNQATLTLRYAGPSTSGCRNGCIQSVFANVVNGQATFTGENPWLSSDIGPWAASIQDGTRTSTTVNFSVVSTTAVSISVSPTSLSFTVQQGTSNPPSQTLTVNYANTSWIVGVSGGGWLSTNSTGGTYGGIGAGYRGVVVYANQSGLSAGTYAGSILLTCPGGCSAAAYSVTIPVTLTVTAPTTAAPTASLTITPATVVAGQPLTYAWNSTNATSWSWGLGIYAAGIYPVSFDACGNQSSTNWSGPTGGNSASGSWTGNTALCQSYTYHITYKAIKDGQTATSQTAIVTVNAPTTITTASLTVTPSTVVAGQPLTYAWNSNNAASWSWALNIYKDGDWVSADLCDNQSSSNWSGPPGGNSASGSWSGATASCQSGYTYNIVYKAYSGAGLTGTVASSQAVVTVTAPTPTVSGGSPNFSLETNVSSVTIPPGGVASYAVGARCTGGFTGPFTITFPVFSPRITNAPAGGLAGGSNSLLCGAAGTFSGVVSLFAQSLAPGTYDLTIAADGVGVGTKTTRVEVVVTGQTTIIVAPTASLTVTPSTVVAGQPLTYAWNSNNAASWSWALNIYKDGDWVSADLCDNQSSSNWSGPPGGNSASGSWSGATASCQSGYTYNIVYKAYSGAGLTGTVASSQAVVTVTAPTPTVSGGSPNFSLETNVSSVTILQGSNAFYSVGARCTGGFTGPFTNTFPVFSPRINNPPAGGLAGSSNSLLCGAAGTFSGSVSLFAQSLAVGTHSLTIAADGTGVGMRTTNVQVVVTAPTTVSGGSPNFSLSNNNYSNSDQMASVLMSISAVLENMLKLLR